MTQLKATQVPRPIEAGPAKPGAPLPVAAATRSAPPNPAGVASREAPAPPQAMSSLPEALFFTMEFTPTRGAPTPAPAMAPPANQGSAAAQLPAALPSEVELLVQDDGQGFAPGPGRQGAPDPEEFTGSLGGRLQWFERIDAYGMLHTQGIVTCGHESFPEAGCPRALRETNTPTDQQAPKSRAVCASRIPSCTKTSSTPRLRGTWGTPTA